MTRSYTDADLAAVRASRRPAWAEIIRITQAAIANNDATIRTIQKGLGK